MGVHCQHSDFSEFAEFDPTGRYGRYNEILGKGSSKIVYRAFDEYEGIEVAWNQVKLHDFLQCPEDLERLYCEIHLLKTLKHKNIMKFYTSWVDTTNMNINFVTEMFTSGTLRQYRQKYRRVNIRAVKHWCREILNGLLYLHSHYPPIIHRDLKCDNILINGNTGEVKIGDLGLAAILRKSHEVHCVGTPEFMAPEVYEEEYNELVDVYSFGMCVLEMVTFEYPYSECTHPAQIYKKVISGTKPEAFFKVEDPEVREFVEKCLTTVSKRLSVRELLNDPFLRTDDLCSGPVKEELCIMGHVCSQTSLQLSECNDTSITSGLSSNFNEVEWDYDFSNTHATGFDLFSSSRDEHLPNVDITIEGKKTENGSIFLKLCISDRNGWVRKICFPFDVENDTALSVATEMVAELDITDHDVTGIAGMIDGEVSSLVPEWRPGPGIENAEEVLTSNLSGNYECTEIHSHFAETTYCVPMQSISESEVCFASQTSIDKQVVQEQEEAEEKRGAENHEKSTRMFNSKPQMKLQQCRSPRLERSRRIFCQSVDFSSNGEHPSPLKSPDTKFKSFHLSRNNSYRIPETTEASYS